MGKLKTSIKGSLTLLLLMLRWNGGNAHVIFKKACLLVHRNVLALRNDFFHRGAEELG